MAQALWALGLDAALLIGAALALWAISIRLRDVSFVDAWWPAGMALVGSANFLASPERSPQAGALLTLGLVWSLRLAGHLLVRWRRLGPDPRYEAMLADARERRGWSFARASLLLVFALQAPLQLVVALPLELGVLPASWPFGWISGAGVLLAAFGAGFEAIADSQLAAFKADPANRGRILDTGLWRYSRHPNYFGEACFWWGAWLLAAGASPQGALSLPGPVLITFLLTRGSGVPTVEGRMKARGAAFQDYVERTSGFIPLPPRRPRRGPSLPDVQGAD